MWTSLLFLVAGCSGGAGPDAEADPSEVVAGNTAVEPELMPELAVPTHPDLVLGSVKPAPADPLGHAPAVAAGDWTLRRTWSSRGSGDWQPDGVEVRWVRQIDPLEVDQLKAAGEEMRVNASRRYGVVGPTFGVVAARQSSGEELADLDRGELRIAPTGTTFLSPWVGKMVTVELKGLQSVTVPAGTFEALWVQRTWAQGHRSTTEDSWWTADHGEVAKVVRVQTRDAAEARMTVLAEFGNLEDPAALRQVWADGRRAMGLEE